jgi:magnesium-protoporphyrin O-methyltransferase
LARQFDEKVAARERRRLLRRGPIRTTQMLAEALREEGVEGATVLDVGGGVGALGRELLEAGARRVIQVEASPAFHVSALDLAEEGGYSDRSEYRLGDFIDLADDIEPADVVALDRVICCYPDVPGLVGRTAEKARQLYAAVYPRERWSVRAMISLQNGLRRLLGNPFRVYVHAVQEIESLLQRAGFERRRAQRTFVWEVAVFGRR